MPKTRIINQQKEENKEQQMPHKPETVFHKKIDDECFLKIMRIVFHSFKLFLSLNKNTL